MATEVGKTTSVWNSAGTWEERDVSKWAQSRLKELLAGTSFDCGEGVSGVISETTKVSGEAVITFPRGKKRIGYELDVSMKYTVTHSGGSHSGKIDIPYLCDDVDDGEFEFKVTCSSDGFRQKVHKAAVPAIKTRIEVFVEELKAK
eukprot:Opistho-2@85032